jgi:hypothetical protein
MEFQGGFARAAPGVTCRFGPVSISCTEACYSGLAYARFRSPPLAHSTTLMKRISTSSMRERSQAKSDNPRWLTRKRAAVLLTATGFTGNGSAPGIRRCIGLSVGKTSRVGRMYAFSR